MDFSEVEFSSLNAAFDICLVYNDELIMDGRAFEGMIRLTKLRRY
jgi:hypothetical protein